MTHALATAAVFGVAYGVASLISWGEPTDRSLTIAVLLLLCAHDVGVGQRFRAIEGKL